MARRTLRLSSTALAAAFVLALVVAASSAARTVGAGRPAPADDHLHAATRATAAVAAAATKQPADQTAATIDASAGPSGCSSNPNNGGGRCPGSHRQISSGNSN
ncbi:hypothetical protein SEVIR_9G161950v4 [Setaria viridis]|uniref:Uncharacterized protein n=1 Tax=Setaria viridis TaxID=4556 RepID=A0A4V6D0X0_SETVI|nr:hypothetical protein SEVIR_9G161950v2 [Setaria viridis]